MSMALLDRLAELGVNVERAGGRIVLDGPEDALTDSLIAEVAAAKPSLLSMLGADGPVGGAGSDAPLSNAVDPALGAPTDDGTTFVGGRVRRDTIDDADITNDSPRRAPWRCRGCGSGERRRRAEWGDWVCAFCRVIVAGPETTDRTWRMVRRCGPFPGTGSPDVTWGRERGHLAVRDPRTGDWHEIPYREAPPVWQAAVRRSRTPPAPWGVAGPITTRDAAVSPQGAGLQDERELRVCPGQPLTTRGINPLLSTLRDLNHRGQEP